MDASEKSIRLRAAFIYVLFLGFLGLVGGRLLQLQVFPSPDLRNLASKQLNRTGKNAPYRLPLLDRNGEELAISVPASSVFARPKLVRHRKRTARVLSGMLGGAPEKWLKKLKSNKSFVWLERQVSPEIAKKIAQRNIPGVFIESENKRIYPNGDLAAHVLGFTDIDGNGISGIELKLNEELLRSEPSQALLKDGRGKTSYLGKAKGKGGSEKVGIYLTIDRRLQNLLEEELERSMEESRAASAMGVILSPTTGEVLAMAQRPTFDPETPNRFPPEALSNRLTNHLLEPGSTLKVIFAAQAIDQGLLNKESLIDCEGGKYRIADKVFSEAHSQPFKKISVEKVLRVSSNIGAVKIAQALGAEKVNATLEKFGMYTKTGIDLPGESSAAPKPAKFWTPIHLATVGFGQGISATPLQVVSAFMPFANGGYWVRPRLVQGEDEKTVLKRILSPKTASSIRDILVGVTEEKGGTGLRARLPHVRIAGKTGTAQKYDREGGYQSGKYYSSFIGFLPADRPEVLIGVMLDEPSKEFYASEIAAPLFRRVAERALPLLRGQPGQTVTAFGEFPQTQSTAPRELAAHADGGWLMPDLRGVSVREAMRLMGTRIDKIKVSGSGYLSEQEPSPGEPVDEKTPIRLYFQPSG
jgi:cell division protein FtsI (penicillin-binding protein 3)